jgi:hypothetical protein
VTWRTIPAVQNPPPKAANRDRRAPHVRHGMDPRLKAEDDEGARGSLAGCGAEAHNLSNKRHPPTFVILGRSRPKAVAETLGSMP